MSKSSKRKPAPKPNKLSPIRPRPVPQQVQPQQKPPRSIKSVVIAVIVGVIGVASGLLTILPHVTVEPTGDVSNPSSISFKITNVGSVPLRELMDDRLGCRIALDVNPTISPSPKECDMRLFPIDQHGIFVRAWLDPGDHYTAGLGDNTFHFSSGFQITYLNLVIRIGYYPWYFPIRQYKLFGFRSWKGDDGKLYWRDYVPDPIPPPDYFWTLNVSRYPADIGFPL
jgi:hypothetical protein